MTNTHKWLGIGLAVCSILVYLIHVRIKDNSRLTTIGLTIMTGLLMVTGHYGGMITHGENYITGALPEQWQQRWGLSTSAEPQFSFENIQEAHAYDDLVSPILNSRCVSCHNPNKLKGSLLLDTKEGIIEGGENGKVIDFSDLAQSELIKLIHLPIDEDRHMPPRGKKPLTQDELKLLTWWVESGADFELQVSQMDQNQEVLTALENIQKLANQKQNPVFDLEVSPISEKARTKAIKKGVFLKALTGSANFVEARVENLDEDLDNTLGGLTDQIAWLNLARSNCTTEKLSVLPKFKNVVKLQLQQTDIDDQALKYVAQLPYLESLNLYGTKVTDEGLKHLADLKYLKQLYLWNTLATAEGASFLTNNNSDLTVDMGLSLQNLDTVNLAAPLVEVDKTIFKDQVEVKLITTVDEAKIYYTLDGSAPGLSSNLYEGPITISQSCDLKAIATKQGWSDSEVASTSFLQVTHVLNDLKLKHPPADQYAAEGVGTLADGLKGSIDFRDGKWLGFSKVDLVADIDLGEITQPKQIVVSCLENLGDYIFYPKEIAIEVSNDGFNYQTANRQSNTVPSNYRAPGLKSFIINLQGQSTRYIRVKAVNVGVCPPWHAGAGAEAWLFVDEIVVN